jgi:RNA polymerase sigma-70 factor (ECF subfamily)
LSHHDPHRQRRTAHTGAAASGAAAARPFSSFERFPSASITAQLSATNEPLSLTADEREHFNLLYSQHFDFVFRNLRRLGVAAASVDDALQEVFLVVLRRLSDLQPGAHVKAWLFAIILRVASNQRRSRRRRGTPEDLAGRSLVSTQPGPFDLTARAQAAEFLHSFLSSLDDNRRAVFIMAELEQLTAPEIAQTLAANLNTVYSWLRSARLGFAKAVHDMHAASGVDP